MPWKYDLMGLRLSSEKGLCLESDFYLTGGRGT